MALIFFFLRTYTASTTVRHTHTHTRTIVRMTSVGKKKLEGYGLTDISISILITLLLFIASGVVVVYLFYALYTLFTYTPDVAENDFRFAVSFVLGIISILCILGVFNHVRVWRWYETLAE